MNKTLALLLLSFVIFSCADKKADPNTLELTGNIKGLSKGKLYIQKVQDTTLIVLDSIIFNGTSSFKSTLKIESPEMLYLFLDRNVSNSLDNNLLFFAEAGKINIDTSLDRFLADAIITGSKNHDLYKKYKEMITLFNDQQLEYIKENILAKNDQEISNKQKQLLKRRYLYAANFALNNANYEVAPYIALTDINDINIKFLDTIQRAMTKKVAISKYGKKLNEYIKERKKLATLE